MNLIDLVKKLYNLIPVDTSKQPTKIDKLEPAFKPEITSGDTLLIDEKKFYDNYRVQFGKLTQEQVSNINFILASLRQYDKNFFTINQLAYILATAYHETGATMKPIVENMNYSAKRLTQVWPNYFKTETAARSYSKNPEKLANYIYGWGTQIGKNLGNDKFGDGYKYRGRGYVQLTGKVNYHRLAVKMGKDFVSNPDLVLQPDIAFKILVTSMMEGTLVPGKKLSDYVNANKTDYYNARRVVNILDRARDIEKYAQKFEKILKQSILN